MSDISKECMICYYWYFEGTGDKYEPYVCNRCHDLLIVVYDLNNFLILNIKGTDYGCFVFDMTNNDAIKLLSNPVLDNNELRNIIWDFCYKFLRKFYKILVKF